MSINYNAIRGFRAGLTMGSVAGYNGSNNIIRDPTRSIHTRDLNKEGVTLRAFHDATERDRICENIKVFARGVDPFGGGTFSNRNPSTGGGGAMSSNPYKVTQDGAFRYEMTLNNRQTLPISRQVKHITYNTAESKVDFSRSRQTTNADAERVRQVTTEVMTAPARPTKRLNIYRPAEPEMEVKYVIQNPVQTSATSGQRTRDITTRQNQTPVKGASCQFNNVYAQTNKISSLTRDSGLLPTANTENYLQETLHSNVISNARVNLQPGAQPLQHTEEFIQDGLNVTYETNKLGSAQDRQNRHLELERRVPHVQAQTRKIGRGETNTVQGQLAELERNLPQYSTRTNVAMLGETNVSTRAYDRLDEGLQVGGFAGRTHGQPQLNRINQLQTGLDDRKINLLRQQTQGSQAGAQNRYSRNVGGQAAALMEQRNTMSNMLRR